jgi:type IV secretion system protein VirD4
MTPETPKPARWRRMAQGCVILAALAAVANVAATQYLAQRFGYHRALGAPWFGHVYAPWAWLEWRARFYAAHRAAFDYVAALFSLGAVLAAALALAVISWRERRAQRHDDVHGTAHWASRAEIEATGLLPRPGKPGAGVYVGGWTDEHSQLRYLRHNGPEHIMALAPTRSGKGVGLVVPTLLSWPHSAVIADQKGELWQMTAGWRESGANNALLRFDPGAAAGSVGFNPLAEIRQGTLNEVGDAQNLVTVVVDPDGKGLADHWAKTAHAFLTGVCLHVLYKAKASGKSGTLPEVALALSDPDRPVEELYQEMLTNTWLNGQRHDVIAAAARDMTNRPDEERGSVLSTAMSFLSLYRDPLVAKNVSRSDFTVMDLMNWERPVSLYLVVRAEDKDRMRPLMRLILNQLVRVLMRPELKEDANGKPLAPHKHRLLLMLDEFPSYGRLEVFQEAMAYIAGYGLKAYIIVQDVAQLWGAYGHDESITSNCHVRVAYAPNKVETAEWLSRMLGTMTVVKEDVTTSGGRFAAVLSNVSRTYHEVSRPLATPDEIMRLKSPAKNESGEITAPGDMLVFASGHAPIYGTQSLYFRDPVFSERAKLPRPSGGRGLGASQAPAAVRGALWGG